MMTWQPLEMPQGGKLPQSVLNKPDMHWIYLTNRTLLSPINGKAVRTQSNKMKFK